MSLNNALAFRHPHSALHVPADMASDAVPAEQRRWQREVAPGGRDRRALEFALQPGRRPASTKGGDLRMAIEDLADSVVNSPVVARAQDVTRSRESVNLPRLQTQSAR